MADTAIFQLVLKGDLADEHMFEAFDGFTALAGFARVLTLSSHFVQTGDIRQKGDFKGRHSVLATPMREGSLVAEFAVLLDQTPALVASVPAAFGSAALMYALVEKIIQRNVDSDYVESDDEFAALFESRSGQIDTLTAISEAPLKRLHDAIGAGAETINIVGGANILSSLNESTKDYLNVEYMDDTKMDRLLTVSSFDGSTGYGRIFDRIEMRSIPFTMNKETLDLYGHIFSWGLDQFVRKTGRKVRCEFLRVLGMDDLSKRYRVIAAEKSDEV